MLHTTVNNGKISFLKAVLGFFAVLCLVCSVSAPAQAGYSAIIFDADSGKVLYESNQHSSHYPASLTKIMTLYLTFEAIEQGKLKMNQRLRVSARASRMPPSKLGLNAGDTITVHDAVLAVITRSANDIAVVLGETLGGSEVRFAQLMTQKARKLGMTRTSFRNASGLPARGQVSTARDMGVLGQAVVRDFPKYYKLFSTNSFTFRDEVIDNHNHLLGNYPGADGIKTGYIRASGFNLVASAQRNGKRLIGVVMGGKSPRWRDRQMQALLDNGFGKLGVYKQYASYPVAPPTALNPMDPDENYSTPHAVSDNETDNEGPSDSTQTTTAAATPAPTVVWGIQIGSYKSKTKAMDMAKQAVKLLDNAPGASIKVAQIANGRKRLYRAQVMGLDQNGASAACSALKQQDLECKPISVSSTAS